MNKTWSMVGNWSAVIGFFGAILLGLFAGLGWVAGASWMTWLLIIAGAFVGALNITRREQNLFLLVMIGITVSTGIVSLLPVITGILDRILSNIAVFGLSAVLVVAVPLLWKLSKKR